MYYSLLYISIAYFLQGQQLSSKHDQPTFIRSSCGTAETHNRGANPTTSGESYCSGRKLRTSLVTRTSSSTGSDFRTTGSSSNDRGGSRSAVQEWKKASPFPLTQRLVAVQEWMKASPFSLTLSSFLRVSCRPLNVVVCLRESQRAPYFRRALSFRRVRWYLCRGVGPSGRPLVS